MAARPGARGSGHDVAGLMVDGPASDIGPALTGHKNGAFVAGGTREDNIPMTLNRIEI